VQHTPMDANIFTINIDINVLGEHYTWLQNTTIFHLKIQGENKKPICNIININFRTKFLEGMEYVMLHIINQNGYQEL
jgi:hypothetical protein